MTSTIEIMSEAEVARARGADREEGFGALRTERGALPLIAMRVDAKIDGLVAHTTIGQTFVNAIGEPMEATYIFPLPDRAAVTSFRLEVGGRVVDGIIEERAQARERYDRAIEQGHRAAITEEERPGVFTMRVGNIMPNEHATVRLTLTGPLPYDEGEATFRFPLVVAPRYIPGTPLGGGDVGLGVALDTDAVPDASRISPPVLLPGFPNPVRLELRAEIRDGRMPISNLKSSLHAIVDRSTEGARVVEVQPGERLNRDFILRWSLAENEIRTSLLLKPDAGGDEGTFLLTVVPPASLSRSTKPRDVVFVLDRSGSMGGWKMIAARRAVARMVDTLRERDRFTVCAFDHSIEYPQDFGSNLVAASDRNRFRAIEFLAAIDARGGTEMAEPLQQSASQLAGGYQDRERAIVLVTDGQVGNEDQILRMLGGTIKNVRIFCVGIDRAVNGAFLRRLADLGGGLSELVESEDRLDEVMDRIHRRLGAPVLTELSISGQDLHIDAQSIAPHRIPDLFAGAPVVIGGRYRGKNGAIRLSGSDASGRSWSETIAAEQTANDAIPTIWARSRVRDLEDRYAVTRDANLEREIVSTSIRFSVLCRFTAFVAVDAAERVNPGGRVQQVVQPVDAPEGWDMFGGGGAVPAGMTAAGIVPMYSKALTAEYEPREMARAISLDDFAAAPPAPARPRLARPAPMKQKKREVEEELAEASVSAVEVLIDRIRRETDPRAAAHALLQALPELLDAARTRMTAEQLREIEELKVKLADPNASTDDLASWVARALELLDPTKADRSRSFWR